MTDSSEAMIKREDNPSSGSSKLTQAAIDSSLMRLDGIAALMDDKFEIPGLNIRIGLDPIIGLIPGGGDWVVWFVSVYIFWEGLRLGVPLQLVFQMASNIAVDLVVGYVPGVGDIFDVAWKANRRNVDLLRHYFHPPLSEQLPEGTTTTSRRLPAASPNDEGSSAGDLPARISDGQLYKPLPPWARYSVGVVITLLLFSLAALPLVGLYYLFQMFAG